ncbi:diguanylate cyclase (GGDEF) domain-containing protein [Phytobacter palmae]|nr:diguanylate cyclase (GGDEF) domain-containing protein [Phytobacter palmae]
MKKKKFYLSLIITVAFLIVSVLLTFQIFSARTQTINELNINVINLSRTLDTYSEGVIRQGEMIIKTISSMTEIYGIKQPEIERIRTLLSDQTTFIEQLNNIVIYDDKGNEILAMRNIPRWGRNGADRSFFIYHRNNLSKDIYIGPPVISRTTGKWVITISKRLEDENRMFRGVVVLTLNIENFLETYGKLDIGKNGSISLISDSGTLMIRFPFNEKFTGKIFSDSLLFTSYLKKSDSGTATVISRVDHIERIFAFQKNKRYGLVTTVAVSTDEALNSWRHHAEILGATIIFLIGCAFFSGGYVFKEISKRMQLNKELANAKESLLSANAQLKEMASVDSLTGLANRREFDHAFPKIIQDCAINKKSISLLLIDIDFFKNYNDKYGHLSGDECLRKVAGIIKESLTDLNAVAARYGGEEFVVILPEAEPELAKNIAESITHNIISEKLIHEASPFGVVSVSTGVSSAAATDIDDDGTSLIESADTALYRAKYSGRNQVNTI